MAKIDLTGQRFGRLTVLEEAEPHYSGWIAERRWLCKCDCGNKAIVRQASLRSGTANSCGCLRRERCGRKTEIDLTGRRFGKLLVLEEAERRTRKDGRKQRQWLCLCDCGKKKVVLQYKLTGGKTKSCGCSRWGDKTVND